MKRTPSTPATTRIPISTAHSRLNMLTNMNPSKKVKKPNELAMTQMEKTTSNPTSETIKDKWNAFLKTTRQRMSGSPGLESRFIIIPYQPQAFPRGST